MPSPTYRSTVRTDWTKLSMLSAHLSYYFIIDAIAENQVKMANDGGIDMLIDLLQSDSEHVQRQAAKALANLGVNGVIYITLSCTIYKVSQW